MKLSEKFKNNNTIYPDNYDKYKLKRGLRNDNGTGVLVGLTQISSVIGYDVVDNVKVPINGDLLYRGIHLDEIVNNYSHKGNFRFEECTYLLLFGVLPTKKQLEDFHELLAENRELPKNFTENMILRTPSKSIMNKLQRATLVLYSHDDTPEDLGSENILNQSINLIAKFPTITSYGYIAKAHYFDKMSLYLHAPQKHLGTAENILYMIRIDHAYTQLEAETLDLCLVLHADHGGGNNSAFATHVVASSGTDTYSTISAAIGSLKGPKHGGASKKVLEMTNDIKKNCDYHDYAALKQYLTKILLGKAFDGCGLIYGMGHAVYTKTDPRAEILKSKALELAKEKGMELEFALYTNIEKITQELFWVNKKKVLGANVDLYSGFVYKLLGIPKELYTPLFAVARVVGWCAHRMEQLMSDQKIIRPAYRDVCERKEYTSLDMRKEL